jgi:HAD superfamily hydrolase (TIGR01509 family)
MEIALIHCPILTSVISCEPQGVPKCPLEQRQVTCERAMPVRNFDLVMFDCDGVLVDSEPIINRAHAEVLSECGYRITPETLLERFCGTSDAEMLGIIESEWGRCLPAHYEARIAEIVDAHCETALAAFPGIHEVLDGLDLPACVVSSGTLRRIRKSLSIVGLLDRFEPHIFSAEMVTRGKPSPELFLYSAFHMGVDTSRCLVIEDSAAGVQGAVSANMTVIGFCGGGHCSPGHGQFLSRHGASAVISHFEELLSSIEALSARGYPHPVTK